MSLLGQVMTPSRHGIGLSLCIGVLVGSFLEPFRFAYVLADEWAVVADAPGPAQAPGLLPAKTKAQDVIEAPPEPGIPRMPSEMPAELTRRQGGREITLPLGETYQLRVPQTIGRYQRYVLSRDKTLSVVRSPSPGGVEMGGTFLTLTGYKFGTVQLTLIGDADKAETFQVHIVPSLSHIEAILLKQFPNSSLSVTQAAENILMVEGTVDSAAEVEPILLLLRNFLSPSPRGQVINVLRVGGAMQVQLDVTVASINRDKARKLGFDFQQGNQPWFIGNQVGNLMAPPQIKTPDGVLLPAAGGANAAALTEKPTLFFGVASGTQQFYGYLQALQDNKCLKVLANPSLVTLSGRPARFIVGGLQPYPVPTNIGQTPGVNFQRYGTELVFTPLVLGQGKIRLDLAPKVSRLDPNNSVTLAGSTVPGFLAQEILATVEMESGQTLVLAGLLESQAAARVQQVPWLGRLPLVGALFRNVEHVEEERELMILATPRLVGPLEPHQYPTRLPGDERRSPTDRELYLHGHPEIPLGECDPPRGLRRAQLDASTQPLIEPYPSWPPRPQSGAGEAPSSPSAPPGDDVSGHRRGAPRLWHAQAAAATRHTPVTAAARRLPEPSVDAPAGAMRFAPATPPDPRTVPTVFIGGRISDAR